MWVSVDLWKNEGLRRGKRDVLTVNLLEPWGKTEQLQIGFAFPLLDSCGELHIEVLLDTESLKHAWSMRFGQLSIGSNNFYESISFNFHKPAASFAIVHEGCEGQTGKPVKLRHSWR